MESRADILLGGRLGQAMLADLAGLDPLVLLAAEGKPPPAGVTFLESSPPRGLSTRFRWPRRPRRAHRDTGTWPDWMNPRRQRRGHDHRGGRSQHGPNIGRTALVHRSAGPARIGRAGSWDAGQTLWLRDVFTGTRQLTTWHGTPGPEALDDDGASTT